MDESYGVDGLHKNGDIAAWDELEQGGRFEDWLYAFNRAENIYHCKSALLCEYLRMSK